MPRLLGRKDSLASLELPADSTQVPPYWLIKKEKGTSLATLRWALPGKPPPAC